MVFINDRKVMAHKNVSTVKVGPEVKAYNPVIHPHSFIQHIFKCLLSIMH